KAIEIPGIHHNDWMSLGGINGDLITSSRNFGTDPTTGKGSPEADRHTAILFENADRLLALAGGSRGSLTQVTIFYQGEHLREHVLNEWRTRSGDRDNSPRLNFIDTDL